MKTLFARVETELGPRTLVMSVADDASPLFQGLAATGAEVAIREATGLRTIAELIVSRDRALVREIGAHRLVHSIVEREGTRL